MLHERESRPAGGTTGPAQSISTGVAAAVPTLRLPADTFADLDARAEHLRGRFVVQVTVDDGVHWRTYVYRNAAAAERAVRRAQDRGQQAHVTLVQMLPVGVVVGLGVR